MLSDHTLTCYRSRLRKLYKVLPFLAEEKRQLARDEIRSLENKLGVEGAPPELKRGRPTKKRLVITQEEEEQGNRAAAEETSAKVALERKPTNAQDATAQRKLKMELVRLIAEEEGVDPYELQDSERKVRERAKKIALDAAGIEPEPPPVGSEIEVTDDDRLNLSNISGIPYEDITEQMLEKYRKGLKREEKKNETTN